ncbi:MAG: hypothetical protein RR348_06250 [Clostridia bacterium]
MNYFSGTASISCDEKGRYRIPSRYRAQFGNSTIHAFKNDDRYLSIISEEKADEIKTKLAPLITLQDSAKSEGARILLANIVELKEDSQGRFSIPSELKGNINFGKEVMFVGVSTKLEMWSKEDWEKYQAEMKSKIDLSQALAEISF